MKIVIAGGSGFLGKRLTEALAARGHEPVVLTRRPHLTPAWEFNTEPGRVRVAAWTPDGGVAGWASVMEGADAVVNLAGESIGDRRWTATRKKTIRDSRLIATRSLVAAMGAATRPPRLLVSMSAVGYYGTERADQILAEDAEPGSDFLAELCVEWEREALRAAPTARVILLRTGLVLSDDGGALPRMLLPFRLFSGGPLGSGRQYVSWIHRADWTGLVAWAMSQPDLNGPLNLTAPNPVSNREFARTVGRTLGRPSWLRTPGFVLRALLGEMAGPLVLGGQRVVPARASAGGFPFRHSTLDSALDAVFRHRSRR
jgi:uncharacterized protein (TIGR01777 family)